MASPHSLDPLPSLIINSHPNSPMLTSPTPLDFRQLPIFESIDTPSIKHEQPSLDAIPPLYDLFDPETSVVSPVTTDLRLFPATPPPYLFTPPPAPLSNQSIHDSMEIVYSNVYAAFQPMLKSKTMFDDYYASLCKYNNSHDLPLMKESLVGSTSSPRSRINTLISYVMIQISPYIWNIAFIQDLIICITSSTYDPAPEDFHDDDNQPYLHIGWVLARQAMDLIFDDSSLQQWMSDPNTHLHLVNPFINDFIYSYIITTSTSINNITATETRGQLQELPPLLVPKLVLMYIIIKLGGHVPLSLYGPCLGSRHVLSYYDGGISSEIPGHIILMIFPGLILYSVESGQDACILTSDCSAGSDVVYFNDADVKPDSKFKPIYRAKVWVSSAK